MTQESIRLSPVQPEQLDQLMPLVAAFYAHFGYSYDNDRKRSLLETFLNDGNSGRLWFIVNSDAPVGYVLIAFSFSLEMEGRIAFVDELFIAPEGRSKGTGAWALSLAEAACRELGVGTLRLEAEADNLRAAALYLRQGYGDLGRRLLSKSLDQPNHRPEDT
ncbi:GNAT family N-acetyltransferase [Cyanobium sp. ATX 6F1]|uniref:GNAT family N-acetyltransferase n=1 Tax=unclassified Cyanobium TaxID=2627006 RepID=UPI0020CDD498|nr:GNAT family N-acetyltransferase [Cyanobium sp. ATX 6F1]MCP9917128.1 GNAT family N-acetyltransferase [Cyanobium sp. ATX 6F1]